LILGVADNITADASLDRVIRISNLVNERGGYTAAGAQTGLLSS